MACALLLASCATNYLGGKGVDYSHYDEPLYDQVADHIKAKVTARLGEGKNDHDRFFIIPFAYQDKQERSWRSRIRFVGHPGLCGSNAAASVRSPGLITRTYKGREFEAFTISWMPHDFPENPNLCVCLKDSAPW